MNYTKAFNAAFNDTAGRSDYAINAGSQFDNEREDQPETLEEAVSYPYRSTPTGRAVNGTSTHVYSGLSFIRSVVRARSVDDGLSNTALLVEKFVRSNHYASGIDNGDNESWCTGFNNDNFRTTYWPPEQDYASEQDDRRGAGSAHSEGVYVAKADGSVALIAYDIDPEIWRAMGSRSESYRLEPPRAAINDAQ